MPTFDPISRCLTARIVYDGPAFAGKTTNITRICELLPVQKRTEVYTPGSLKGRTMFFDWLEVDLGRLNQLPFRCQILSVPGQRARSYRRRPLIQSADAIVFVGDSRPEELDETRRCFALMRRYLRERGEPVPVVVQVNKQDAPGALSREDLGPLLRLGSDVPTFPAVATSGEGVRETFNAAVRAAARYAQHRVAELGIRGVSGATQDADGLLDALLVLEDQIDDVTAEEEPTEEELSEVSGE